MAATSIRTTYALDAETVARLDRLARQWNLSKSATLRKLIREAEPVLPTEPDPRLAALRALQQSLSRLTPKEWSDWQRDAREERQASSRQRLDQIYPETSKP